MPQLVRYAAVPGIEVGQPQPGVTLVTLDRPHCSNALDEPMLLGLVELFDAIGRSDTRAVIITGGGGAFSAGGDLDVVRSVAAAPPEWTEEFLNLALRPALALYRLPQPTIAAVNGAVAGGGLGLALACDLRLAAPAATFSASFIHMGLVPDLGTSWLLPRIMGPGPALEFTLSGRCVGAQEAEALDLVNRICDHPLRSAFDLATVLADAPPRAAAVTKLLLRQALDTDLETAIRAEAHHQAAALHGPEFAERYGAWRSTVTGAAS